MMNACPFDSFLRQSPSPICFIFTEDEWKGWNYQYDLTQFGELCPVSLAVQGMVEHVADTFRQCWVWRPNRDRLGCRLGGRDDRQVSILMAQELLLIPTG
jgi:hypothetical protein